MIYCDNNREVECGLTADFLKLAFGGECLQTLTSRKQALRTARAMTAASDFYSEIIGNMEDGR